MHFLINSLTTLFFKSFSLCFVGKYHLVPISGPLVWQMVQGLLRKQHSANRRNVISGLCTIRDLGTEKASGYLFYFVCKEHLSTAV